MKNINLENHLSIDSNKWAKLFYDNYKDLLKIAETKIGNTLESENIVDALIIKVLQRKKGINYENDEQAINYLRYSLRKNIKQWYAIKYHNELPKLTNDEREYWFEYTRNFFDNRTNYKQESIEKHEQ